MMKIVPTVAPRGPVWRASCVAALAVTAVAGLGMLLTDLGPWYQSLKQPAWKPPDSWFGPAWTLIYTLAAVAAVRAWLRAEGASDRLRLLLALALNATLNLLWSALFFRLRRPDWALAEVLFFWLSIAVLILVTRRGDAWALWLLMPYLLWVAFAAAINLAVVRLNALP